MKRSIKFLAIALAFCVFSLPTSAGIPKGLRVFTSDIGVVGMISNGKKHSLFSITGGYPNGAVTGGKCIIKGELQGEKSIRGRLVPLETSIMSYGPEEATREIYATLASSSIEIYRSDVFGLCGLGVTFDNWYDEVTPEDENYKGLYFELLEYVHENAVHLFKSDGARAAVTEMSSYIDGRETYWSNITSEDKQGVVYLNDYGYFLQLAGESSSAIKTLKKVVSIAPQRSAAWLNLGDAYWDARDRKNARQAYGIYLKLLGREGISKYPARVDRRLHN